MRSNTTPIVLDPATANSRRLRRVRLAFWPEGITMGEMPAWLDWLRKPGLPPGAREKLRGVPAVRRVKNYAAFSGYVYEYFFEGYRDTREAREFVFTVSGDRKSWCAFQVRLRAGATQAWEREQDLTLGDRERYALAKLALFSAFDDRDNPTELGASIEVTPEMAVELLRKLDL